ncbi:MAG: Cj0069 family protein [Acidimicrobiales bacterium]
MSANGERVVVLWRATPNSNEGNATHEVRYPNVVKALAAEGFAVSHVAYREEDSDDVKRALLASEAVLVWADPLSGDLTRDSLDMLLRTVSRAGVLVHTHPDTILKMGTKDVLYDTRTLSWSLETDSYPDHASFVEQFAKNLSDGSARVLKQHRGNGGIGVWKVQALAPFDVSARSEEISVRIQHAAPRDGQTEDVALSNFMERMRAYFESAGHLIDQAFAPRVSEGMVRAYLVKADVVGFARQYADRNAPGAPSLSPDRVFGIPAPKTMLDVECDEFADLRKRLEDQWVPALMDVVSLSHAQLPLLWDADFLFGPKSADGRDTYRLCEINVSCVSPFPDAAPLKLARALASQLAHFR